MNADSPVESSSATQKKICPPTSAEACFLGLGSNLDEPKHQVGLAIAQVAKIPSTNLLAQSSYYRSAPMGPQDQSSYINVVLKISTSLAPLALLGELQSIENAFGRDRSVARWGPRIIDLDILLFGQLELVLKKLRVPHPGLTERDFVVSPLLEIAPQLRLPNGKLLADYAAGVSSYGLERL